MFFYKKPAYLFHAFLLEADDVQVKVLPEPVGFVEGDAPGQAVPPRLGTQTHPPCGTQQQLLGTHNKCCNLNAPQH